MPGLDKRFNAKAAYFLDGLLAEAVQQMIESVGQTQSLLSRFNGVYIADSTVIALPTELASVFEGHNGSAAAAAKVAVQWEMNSGGLNLWLSAARVHDQRTGIVSHSLPPGALRLNDLGFFNLNTFAADVERGVHFFSRYKRGTLLYSSSGEALDLVTCLRRRQQALDMCVQIGQQRLPTRLIALPITPAQTGKRRKHLHETARRRQRPVSQEALELSGWTLFITSLPTEQLTLEEAATLGCTRWQIECLFKLWKSEGLLDDTRSQDPHRVWCEFYAKLLALLIQHWLMLVSCWQRLDRSLHQAAQVIRKHALALAAVLTDDQRLRDQLQSLARILFSTCGMSKRRAHPLTFQLWLKAAHV